MLSENVFIKKLCKNEKRVCDAAFAFMLVFFVLYFIARAQKGINTIDESFYYTIPHRFFSGDRLIVDEWHVSQFSGILQYLPYCVFRWINGSNDGVILFFRYFFTVAHCLVASAVYFALRKKRPAAALVSSFVYTAYVPLYILSADYYTLAIAFSVLFCLLFFVNERKSALKYVLCGVLFSCAVLAEPLISLIYVGYSAVLLVFCVRKKTVRYASPKYGFFADTRVWLFLSVGIVLSAAALLIPYFICVPFGDFCRTVPFLFGDSEYNFGASGNIIELSRLSRIVKAYSPLAIVLCAVLAVFLVAKRKNIDKMRHAVLSLLAAAYAAVTVYYLCFCFFFDRLGFHYQPVLLQFIAGLLLLTLEKRDARLVSVWVFGLCFSVLVDISSATTVANTIGFGSIISNTASVTIVFSACAREVFVPRVTEKRKKKTSAGKAETFLEKHAAFFARTGKAAFAVFMCTLIVSEVCLLIEQQRFNAVEGYYCKSEQPLDTVLETGPYKGIRTTSDISEKYAAYLEDLDSIREEYDAAICIVGLQPWQYLYLDLPYGTYSTWFVGADFAERNWQYWLLHPEKTPAFFYLPYYSSYNWEKDEKTFEARQRDLNEMFSLSRTEGKAGYIFYVK